MNNLVSVIIPCYNQAQYLPLALDAVLQQTYGNWECIMVNDGSPDSSEEIALQYCAKDSRFKYHKKANGGLSSARNAGLKLATGSWIQFLDSDDYIAPEKIKRSLDALKDHPDTKIIVSNFKMFTHTPADATKAFCELKQELLNFESLLFGWDVQFNIPIHCGLFSADLFTDNPFVETLKSNEDWVMWLNIFEAGPGALYINYPMAYYRINPNSMTKDKVFVRISLAESFKYILNALPKDYAVKFACNIIDKYQAVITGNENDINYFKNRPPYRFEVKLRGALKKLLTFPKKKKS